MHTQTNTNKHTHTHTNTNKHKHTHKQTQTHKQTNTPHTHTHTHTNKHNYHAVRNALVLLITGNGDRGLQNFELNPFDLATNSNFRLQGTRART